MALLLCFLTYTPNLWSIKEPGIQTPIRWLPWGASLPSSWSASSQFKSLLASAFHFSDSLVHHAVSRVSLDSAALLTNNFLRPMCMPVTSHQKMYMYIFYVCVCICMCLYIYMYVYICVYIWIMPYPDNPEWCGFEILNSATSAKPCFPNKLYIHSFRG